MISLARPARISKTRNFRIRSALSGFRFFRLSPRANRNCVLTLALYDWPKKSQTLSETKHLVGAGMNPSGVVPPRNLRSTPHRRGHECQKNANGSDLSCRRSETTGESYRIAFLEVNVVSTGPPRSARIFSVRVTTLQSAHPFAYAHWYGCARNLRPRYCAS